MTALGANPVAVEASPCTSGPRRGLTWGPEGGIPTLPDAAAQPDDASLLLKRPKIFSVRL
jgi:hypothetical protein